VVGFATETGKTTLTAIHPNWISGKSAEIGKVYDVMVRYRAKPVPALLTMSSDDKFRLEFKQKLRGITPGQVAVLYQGERCLGGGVINESA
jgi:tRNA-specific 2-thiouridylase